MQCMTTNLKNAIIIAIPLLAIGIVAYFFFFSVKPFPISLASAQAMSSPVSRKELGKNAEIAPPRAADTARCSASESSTVP